MSGLLYAVDLFPCVLWFGMKFNYLLHGFSRENSFCDASEMQWNYEGLLVGVALFVNNVNFLRYSSAIRKQRVHNCSLGIAETHEWPIS